MLQNTFVHIPKVSRNAEIKLWRDNIHSWQDFIDNQNKISISDSKKELLSNHITKSIEALKNKEYDFFSSLPNNQHWRMYDLLKKKTCFLDIETTGLSSNYDNITLIGIHSDEGTKIFMKDKDLDKFSRELKKYDKIVTFNGKCFDLPFIKNKFPDTNFPIFHTDLRYVMADLGFRGGLKNIERVRGISRDDDIEEMSGFDAVILWRRYEKGDNSALVKLKKYLTADVENLPTLMNLASTEMKQKYFFDVIKN
jgi:uncharacterized protein YprB with RNaseH-like and TPR domain